MKISFLASSSAETSKECLRTNRGRSRGKLRARRDSSGELLLGLAASSRDGGRSDGTSQGASLVKLGVKYGESWGILHKQSSLGYISVHPYHSWLCSRSS